MAIVMALELPRVLAVAVAVVGVGGCRGSPWGEDLAGLLEG